MEENASGNALRGKALARYYPRLLRHFGRQHWWPGRTRFEIILGAMLTQNTAWTNVEKSLQDLRKQRRLSPRRLRRVSEARLCRWLRPSGTYRQKTRLVRRFLRHLFDEHRGSLRRLFRLPTWAARADLLTIPGIGPETADSVLLYAGNHPVFVIDSYTRRILVRHGLASSAARYDELQRLFEENLPRNPELYNEYHALLVAAGKDYCHKQNPDCAACPLGAELQATR